MKKILFSVLAVLFLAATAGPVSADGGGPVRPATEAEKTYNSTVLKTFKDAMPKALEGWEMIEGDAPAPLETVNEGFEKYPCVVNFSSNWKKKISPEDENKKLEEGAKIMKAGEEKMQEISKKQEALSVKIGKAVEAGNMAEMEKLKPEMEKIAKEAEAYAAEQQKKLGASSFAELSRDVKADIHIETNASSFSIDSTVKETAKIEDALAFRSETEENIDGREGRTTILIGDWKRKQDGEAVSMEAALDAKTTHTRAQTIKIDIIAAKATAEKLVRSMDIKSLKALLK